MLLGGLQKLTLIDFPGRVAATVFTIGCNFFCPFCYNSELVDAKKIKKHPQIPEEDFFNFLKERQGMLDGVCITGGEPTLQADLPEFIKKIKELRFLVKLDTNGARPEILSDLLEQKLVDYIAMDIKGPLEKYHKFADAADILEKIHQSTQIIRQMPDYEFRTTAVPSLHEKEDFLSIARWLEGAKKYYIQQFKAEKTLDSAYSSIKPYPDEQLVEFCQIAKPYFEICEVRV
ncbi:MAG: anaerobic ribonucleoside-triphosphate reductase activating protein [Candidatus Portnoybacteria bacterium]|nr:anaerobic ribonucleoside-triphosphate reductase activating protein [Candidatus Portnoybacteria bacterium]